MYTLQMFAILVGAFFDLTQLMTLQAITSDSTAHVSHAVLGSQAHHCQCFVHSMSKIPNLSLLRIQETMYSTDIGSHFVT